MLAFVWRLRTVTKSADVNSMIRIFTFLFNIKYNTHSLSYCRVFKRDLIDFRLFMLVNNL